MKITLVGGFFDNNFGKKSLIIDKLAEELSKLSNDVLVYNGGNISSLREFNPCNQNILIWMPNIDNSEDKILPLIKEKNSKMILVSSKRIVEKDFYKDSDVIGRLLKSKSNLGITVKKNKDNYVFSVLDPLGNKYVETESLKELSVALNKRLIEISKLTRVSSVKQGPEEQKLNDDKFIEIVKNYGDMFSKHINAVNPNRLLGNASTRCSYGFPSKRESDYYFVSERNVDKKTMTSDNFVKVLNTEDNVLFVGGFRLGRSWFIFSS